MRFLTIPCVPPIGLWLFVSLFYVTRGWIVLAFMLAVLLMVIYAVTNKPK